MRNILEIGNAQPAYAGRSGAFFLTLWMVSASSVWGQSSLPAIEGVDCRGLRGQSRELLAAFAKLKASLPKETEGELRALIRDDSKDSEETAERIQKLLNAQCLVGVSINPESRVKAARGPRSAELEVGHETIALIRILNEAGGTHGLSLER